MEGATTSERIRTPFGYETTAAEVVEAVDLTGKRAIVTGGASGIGVETARALAGVGATVTLAVRRTGDGEEVARDIRSSTGNDEVEVAHLERDVVHSDELRHDFSVVAGTGARPAV